MNSPDDTTSPMARGEGGAPPPAPSPARIPAVTGGGVRWVPPMPLELQEQLPQYKVLELLGRGGMGAVFKGWQNSLEPYVAIKILPPGIEDDGENFAERYQSAADMRRALDVILTTPVEEPRSGDSLRGFAAPVADQASTRDRGVSPPRKSRAALITTMLGSLAVLGLGAFYAFKNPEAPGSGAFETAAEATSAQRQIENEASKNGSAPQNGPAAVKTTPLLGGKPGAVANKPLLGGSSAATGAAKPRSESPLLEKFLTAATKAKPFMNSLGMKFVPVPILSGRTALRSSARSHGAPTARYGGYGFRCVVAVSSPAR